MVMHDLVSRFRQSVPLPRVFAYVHKVVFDQHALKRKAQHVITWFFKHSGSIHKGTRALLEVYG